MPADRTPAGDEMDEVRPTPRFPEREPGGRRDGGRQPDIEHRPAIPDHPPKAGGKRREDNQREASDDRIGADDADKEGLDTRGGA